MLRRQPVDRFSVLHSKNIYNGLFHLSNEPPDLVSFDSTPDLCFLTHQQKGHVVRI